MKQVSIGFSILATFFNDFPKLRYNMNKTNERFLAVHILKRFQPLEEVIAKASIYYQYIIKEGERPDIVSHKVYGSVDYDWIILMFNKYMDPYFHWPMDYDSFKRFLINKYGSVENSMQSIHHYEKIIQSKEILYDGTVVPEKVLKIDQTAYNALPANERKLIYAYDYENQLNEDKRIIKILHKSYIPQIDSEKKVIFNARATR